MNDANRKRQSGLSGTKLFGAACWLGGEMMSLTDHQSTQLHLATSGPVGILAGGPGTGKTYTVAEVAVEAMGDGVRWTGSFAF